MSLDLTSQPTSDTRDGLGPLHSNEIIIGLALGSPRENNDPSWPDDQIDNHHLRPPPSRAGLRVDYSDNASQLSQTSPPRRTGRSYASNDGLKRSGSKWKNLGGLFSKKGPSAPPFDGQPFYMLDQPVQRVKPQTTEVPIVFEQVSAQDPPSKRAMSPLEPQAQTICSADPPRQTGAKAMLRRASTRRLGIRKRARAQTGSSLESNRGSSARLRIEERRRSEEAMEPSAWPIPHGHQNRRAPTASPWLLQQQRLLEVDIPSVELERYSVMFGEVLKTKPGKSGNRASRRQSQMREFKPKVTGKENNPSGLTFSPLSSNPPLALAPVRPEHTRMDSTSSSGSKSSTSSAKYGLFPSAGPLQKRNTPHKPRPKPSPLSRSVTAPNASANTLHQPTASTIKNQAPDEVMIVIQETEALPAPEPESNNPPTHQHQRSSSFNPSDLPTTTPADDHSEDGDQYSDYEPPRPSTANATRAEKAFSRSAFPVRKSSMRAPRNTPVTTPPIPQSDTLLPAPLSIPSTPSSTPATLDLDPTPTSSPLEGHGQREEKFSVAPLTTHKKSKPAPLNLAPTKDSSEVAIARQVSITRRQQTVVPIVPLRAKLVEDVAFPVRKDSFRRGEVAVGG